MIKLGAGVSGRFKIEKFKAVDSGNGVIEEIKGSRKVCADWFDNLILDQGLNGLGTRSINASLSNCHVGTGSAAPLVTDTSLTTFLAQTSTTQASSEGGQTAILPYYRFLSYTKRFGAGVAAGILAEVGMGWGSSSSNLFSKTLIKDGGGSPTTITVLADEYLDVTYELRIYPDLSDFTGTVVIGGITYDYTARVALFSNAGYWATSKDGLGASTSFSRVYSGAISGVLSLPSGSSYGASSSVETAYSNNSLEGVLEYTWNIGVIDFAFRSALLVVGWTCWQIEFSAQGTGDPVPTDLTKTLKLSIGHSWARGSI